MLTLCCSCLLCFCCQFSVKLNVQDSLYLAHLLIELLRLHKRGVWFQSLAASLGVRKVAGHLEPVLVNEHNSLLVEPLDTLPVLPEAVLDGLLAGVDVGSESMLLALVPPAFVLASISPVVHTVAFFLVIQVLSVVAHAISVDVDAVAAHVVVGPLTEVLAAVLPEVGAESIDLVVQPLSFVGRSVGPSVFAEAFLLAHHVLALVLRTLRPGLETLTVLLVFLPLTFVSCAFYVGVDAVTVSLVVKPLAVVNVAIGMEEFTLAASHVILPMAFVACIVRPHHRALAVSKSALPLARVDGASSVSVDALCDGGIGLVVAAKRLFCLVSLEILASYLASEFHDTILASLQESADERLHANKHHCLVHSRLLLASVDISVVVFLQDKKDDDSSQMVAILT